jgi:hypothetical protein
VRAELLGADDPAWTEVLARVPHDFHHLPGYATLSAEHEVGTARALLVEDGPRGMLLPLVIRPVPGGALDATSPYGYAGPLTWGDGGGAFSSGALAAGIELLREAGVVSLFIRLHPILNREPPAGIGTLVKHGETVSIDLTQSNEALWSQTRQNHRRDIVRATKAGRGAVIDEDWVHFDTFARLYRETMERLAAEDRHKFDEGYFQRLRQVLGSSLTLWVVPYDDDIAAAGLFVETSGIVQYHLSGTDARYTRDGPTKLLLHGVRVWAKDRGDVVFHLGGGVGAADDSLLHFKAGFSDQRLRFHTLRVVVDPDEYARLVTASGPGLDPADLEGFFPLYRASTPGR